MNRQEQLLKNYILSEIYNIEKYDLLTEGRITDWLQGKLKDVKRIFQKDENFLDYCEKKKKERIKKGDRKSAERWEKIADSHIESKSKNRTRLTAGSLLLIAILKIIPSGGTIKDVPETKIDEIVRTIPAEEIERKIAAKPSPEEMKRIFLSLAGEDPDKEENLKFVSKKSYDNKVTDRIFALNTETLEKVKTKEFLNKIENSKVDRNEYVRGEENPDYLMNMEIDAFSEEIDSKIKDSMQFRQELLDSGEDLSPSGQKQLSYLNKQIQSLNTLKQFVDISFSAALSKSGDDAYDHALSMMNDQSTIKRVSYPMHANDFDYESLEFDINGTEAADLFDAIYASAQ